MSSGSISTRLVAVVADPVGGVRAGGSTSSGPGGAGSGGPPRACSPASSGSGAVHAYWCWHGDEREAHAGERRRRLRAPEAGAEDDVLGRDRAVRRLDAAHASALDADTGRLGSRRRPAARPPRSHARAIASAARTRLARCRRRSTKRPPMIRSGSRSGMRSATSPPASSSSAVEPVAERAAVAAVELCPPLLGRRDLDSADRVVARQPVELEPARAGRPSLRELRSSCATG